jgi:hypothetical protein
MSTQETEVRTGGAVDFNAAAEKAKSNGHAASSTNVGNDSHITEIFPWRPEGEGKAPIKIEIRPHVFKQSDLSAIDTAAEDAGAARSLLSEKRTKLIEKRISLEADRFIEQEIDDVPEDESETLPKLAKVHSLIAQVEQELEAAPTSWEKRAELFFVPVVKSWPLTYIDEENGEEKLIPLKAKAIATLIDPVRLGVLNRDLQSFLFRDRSRKKK